MELFQVNFMNSWGKFMDLMKYGQVMKYLQVFFERNLLDFFEKLW